MNAECELRLCFDSASQAAIVASSVEIDDQGFVKTHTDENLLLAEMSASSILSLLQTVNDYLACVGVAAKLTDKD